MPRSGKTVALLCIALVVFAGFFTASVHITVDLTPLWPVVPDRSSVQLGCDDLVRVEQGLCLVSLSAPRAPPAAHAFG
jgi:hypothetical protein